MLVPVQGFFLHVLAAKTSARQGGSAYCIFGYPVLQLCTSTMFLGGAQLTFLSAPLPVCAAVSRRRRTARQARSGFWVQSLTVPPA